MSESDPPSDPKPKRLKANASTVHDEFTRARMKHPRTDKWIDSSVCKHCKEAVPGILATNLKSHLKVHDPEVYQKVIGINNDHQTSSLYHLDNKYSGADQANALKRKDSVETRTPLAEAIIPGLTAEMDDKRKKKNKQVHFFTKNIFIIYCYQAQSWSKEDQSLSDKLLAVWVGSTGLPMSLVDDPNFHRLLESLNSNVRKDYKLQIPFYADLNFSSPSLQDTSCRRLLIRLWRLSSRR